MAEQQLNLLATSEFPAISLASQRDFHMMASIKAPVIQADIRDRAPIDLVAVIDKSGSMSGDKIDLVKKTCNFILKQLTSSDRFSVVSYDTDVQIEFGLTNMTPAHKKTSATKINNIHVGSSTNLSGGLLTGLDLLINDNSSSKSPVSSVFLLTDGQANAGITSGKELAKVVQERLKKMSNPCSIFTFGFGADHDESFLTQISDQGSGMYYFVKDEEAISTAFADALGGLLSVVAQNIQMTITPVNGVRIQKTLGVIAPPKKNKNKEEDDAPEDNNEENEDTDMADDEKTVLDQEEDQKPKRTRGNKSNKQATIKKEAKPVIEEVVGSEDPVTVYIGDLYSEEGRDVVLKLYMPATENTSDVFELAKVKLTYFNPRSNNATCETSISCTVQRKDEVSAEEQVRDFQVDKQINRLLAAECMEAAKTEASNGNLEKARQMLNDTINIINASVSSKDALCQDLVADLQQILGSLKSEQTWNNVGAKEVAWIASAHKRQRGAGKGGKAYQNEAKRNMVKKAQDYNDDDDEEDQDDYNDEESDLAHTNNDVDMPSTTLKRKYDQISNTRGKGGKGLGTGIVPQQQQQQPVQMFKTRGKGLGKGAPVAQQQQQQQAPSLKKSTKHVAKKGKWSAPQSY